VSVRFNFTRESTYYPTQYPPAPPVEDCLRSRRSDAARAPSNVVTGHDPLLDELGYDPRSAYVEWCWLGIIGPSATFAARALAGALAVNPDGGDVPLAALAGQLGLNLLGLLHALDRLCRFGLATTYGGGLAFRRKWPPIAAPQVARLPRHLQVVHALESDRVTA
jgi:hypothetical protein